MAIYFVNKQRSVSFLELSRMVRLALFNIKKLGNSKNIDATFAADVEIKFGRVSALVTSFINGCVLAFPSGVRFL